MIVNNNQRIRIPLFISHLHKDKPLVDIVNRLIDEIFSRDFEIFNTSKNPPGAGKKWREEIKEHLEKAHIVLAILTPQSAKRDWVMFEAGAAWFSAERKEKYLIPCLYNLDEFPSPLSEYQGINLASKNGIYELVELLRSISGLQPVDSLIDGKINEYLEALRTIKLPNEDSLKNPLEDGIKLLNIIESFFKNEREAARFTKLLSEHNIIDKEVYTYLLDKQLKQKYSGQD